MMACMNLLIPIAVLTQLSHGNHIFTSRIYENLSKAVKGNLVYSPLAAESVLAALALAGAEGETKEEILDVLKNPDKEEQFAHLTSHLYQSADENVTLASAYKVFISNEYQINKTFIDRSKKKFRVEVENINFNDSVQAAKIINTFVENNSKHRLKDLINPVQLGPTDKIILVNTLYQSNIWKYPFTSSFEGDIMLAFLISAMKASESLLDIVGFVSYVLGDFSSSSGEITKVKYLQGYGDFRTSHCGFLGVTYLELPFKYNNISLIIILPDDKDGLERVEEHIVDVLEPHRTGFLKRHGIVRATIPKFFIDLDLDFKPYLKEVKVERVFNQNEAQLPWVSNKVGLYVNSIPQKAIVNITELGNDLGGIDLEVPASTLFRPPFGPGPVVFPVDVNHPFLFYIRDDISTLLLFVGRFNNN